MLELPRTTFAFLAGSAIIALATGFTGWSLVYGPDAERDLWDALYHTLLAFAGDGSFIASDGDTQLNPWIRISRFFALLTTLTAIATVTISLLGNRILRLWARFLSGHTVVIGTSRFVMELVKHTKSVVVFDTVERLGELTTAQRGKRTILLPDKMKDFDDIARVLGNPSQIIFGDIDTITNVERARAWLKEGCSPGDKLKVRIEDNVVARDLELLSKDFSHTRLISRSETTARALVTSIAPIAMARTRGQARVHFALVGLGKTNLAVAEELALRCHHHALRPLRLTIIDKDITAAKARIRTERPDLLNPEFEHSGFDIAFLEMNALECCSTAIVPKIIDIEQELPFTGVVVSAGDDAMNTAIAMRLRQLQVEKLCLKAPIFMGSDSQGSVSAARIRDLTGGVVPFGGLYLSAEDRALETLHEDLAKAIHNRWRASPDVKATEENKWENLSTLDRRASYRAALASVEMFYEAGFYPPIGQNIAGMRIEPRAANATLGDAPLKARMARTEHERWCRERRLEGFTRAADGLRDNEKKRHPLLVSYTELVALKDPVQIQKDVENVELAFNLGIARHEKDPKAPCWRMALRIGVMGPLSVDDTQTRNGVRQALDKLVQETPDILSHDLEILTPNAPGFDRLAAHHLAEAWREKTDRPCRILLFNAAGLKAVDDIALRHVGKDAKSDQERDAIRDTFLAQTRSLEGLEDASHAVRTLDLRDLGVSDDDLRNDMPAYENVLSRIQKHILNQADLMIFDTNGGKANFTSQALSLWENEHGQKGLVVG